MIPRVHALSVNAGTPTLTLKLFADAPTREDPSLDFYVTTALGSTVFALSGAVAPLTTNGNLALITGFGNSVRVQLSAAQGTTPATVFWVVVSVDLVLKS
jgi:hypothetical protein